MESSFYAFFFFLFRQPKKKKERKCEDMDARMARRLSYFDGIESDVAVCQQEFDFPGHLADDDTRFVFFLLLSVQPVPTLINGPAFL